MRNGHRMMRMLTEILNDKFYDPIRSSRVIPFLCKPEKDRSLCLFCLRSKIISIVLSCDPITSSFVAHCSFSKRDLTRSKDFNRYRCLPGIPGVRMTPQNIAMGTLDLINTTLIIISFFGVGPLSSWARGPESIKKD